MGCIVCTHGCIPINRFDTDDCTKFDLDYSEYWYQELESIYGDVWEEMSYRNYGLSSWDSLDLEIDLDLYLEEE
jgi:hypothetical protein